MLGGSYQNIPYDFRFSICGSGIAGEICHICFMTWKSPSLVAEERDYQPIFQKLDDLQDNDDKWGPCEET